MKVQGIATKNIYTSNLPKTNISINSANATAGNSTYNSICINGLNYHNPSFGHLYKEGWSEKRIFEIIRKAGDEFDKLYDEGSLNIENLNKIISSILPKEVGSRIEVEDFIKYKGIIKKKKGQFDGATCSYEDGTVVAFLRFDEINDSSKKEEDNQSSLYFRLKEMFLHELTHAIHRVCTNDMAILFLRKDVEPYIEVFNDLFLEFENRIHDEIGWFNHIAEISAERYLPWESDCEYIEILPRFKNSINDTINLELNVAIDTVPKKDSTLSGDIFKTTGFYRYMRLRAEDEKVAYKTGKIWDGSEDSDCAAPYYEIKPTFYKYIEEFFEKKELEAEEQEGGLIGLMVKRMN